MNSSIAKKILIRNAIIIFLILVTIVIILFNLVKNIVISNTENLSDAYARELVTCIETYSALTKKPLNQISSENIKNDIGELCNEENVDYVYMFEPDTENGTIKYYLLESKNGTDDIVQKHKSDLEEGKKYTLTEDELSVWNGEKAYSHNTTNNYYGYEFNSIALAEDNFGNKALAGVDVSVDMITNSILTSFLTVSCFLFLIFVIIILVQYFIIRSRVSKPVKQIVNAMENFIADGNKQHIKLNTKNRDEFGMIFDSFNTMADRISDYIDNIEALNREKEQQKAEMKIASDIQNGLLPDKVSDNKFFSIDAYMKPAKNVGGDLYDYLDIDEDNTLMVVADVSGKGYSGALFMSMTLTLIRLLAQQHKSPSEILRIANNQLSQRNPQMLFVTAFLCIYNNKTGTLTYSNAGHNIPYVINSSLHMLDNAKGTPLGMFANEEYTQSEFCLKNADILFMYTDGVNEAVSRNKEFYGIERLEKNLLSFNREGDTTITEYICNSVKEFTSGAEQSDDITILSMTVRDTEDITVNADLGEFSQIRNIIMCSNIPQKLKLKMCLACEEWFVNICSYGYENTEKEKQKIYFSMTVTDKIIIRFEDNGKKYNPLEDIITPEEYDISNQIGGLGKLIIVKTADDVSYEYKENKNILTITKYLKEEQYGNSENQ